MKVLITGGSGLLGSALAEETRTRRRGVVALTRADLDVESYDDCARVVAREAPDVVLHCAAYTAVDRAEEEPSRAHAVNVLGTRNVVEATARSGAFLVYPSTDYVFGDGRRDHPWRTDEPTRPQGIYARTKLEGEEVVRSAGPGHLVVRTSWLYGPGGRNFVDTILRLARDRASVRVVNDQVGRPTWTASLARTMWDLIEREARGTYHAADGGTATWYDLALEAVRLSGVPARVEPVSTGEFGAAAPRPAYSALDLEKTETLVGRAMPHWRVNVAEYLRGGRTGAAGSEGTARRAKVRVHDVDERDEREVNP